MAVKRARPTSTTSAISPVVVSGLSKMQNALNKFIDADWRKKRSADDWGLAVTLESAELIDSYPWKWWKSVKATPNFGNVRVELVDILHFSLSGTMQMDGVKAPTLPDDIDTAITSPLSDTKNAIHTFRQVIYLAKYHQFQTITAMIIEAAEDLEFNIVGYYIAKHTLNYIRQLSGYKEGTYAKVKEGVEDNELLHAAIEKISLENVIDEKGSAAAWDEIMVSVYKAFNVNEKDQKDTKYWLGQSD